MDQRAILPHHLEVSTMAHSIRTKEFKETVRRVRHGGATVSVEARIDAGEFTDAASAALEKQIEQARARNGRRSAIRAPHNFTREIRRNVIGTQCHCGNRADNADHIIPIEAFGMLKASMLNEIGEFLGDDNIRNMTRGEFMKSASNAQGLCSNCNNKRKQRFIADKNKPGFTLLGYLKAEQEIAKRFSENTDMVEVKARFSKELHQIKKKIRNNSEARIDERTLNASNYEELHHFNIRRDICLQFGVYMGKTEFAKEKKRLLEELANR